jgi:hypothetical protein
MVEKKLFSDKLEKTHKKAVGAKLLYCQRISYKEKPT